MYLFINLFCWGWVDGFLDLLVNFVSIMCAINIYVFITQIVGLCVVSSLFMIYLFKER